MGEPIHVLFRNRNGLVPPAQRAPDPHPTVRTADELRPNRVTRPTLNVGHVDRRASVIRETTPEDRLAAAHRGRKAANVCPLLCVVRHRLVPRPGMTVGSNPAP